MFSFDLRRLDDSENDLRRQRAAVFQGAAQTFYQPPPAARERHTPFQARHKAFDERREQFENGTDGLGTAQLHSATAHAVRQRRTPFTKRTRRAAVFKSC